LGAVALVGAGIAETVEAGEALLKAKIDEGTALEKFKQLIAAQQGELHFLQDSSVLPQPDRILMIPASQAGYVANIDALEVAKSAKLVGAGRITKDAPIHLGVGILLHKKVGDAVKAGETLVELYAGDTDHFEAMNVLKNAFTFSAEPVSAPPLVEEIMLGEVFRKPLKA
jgi:pyrimidine-nucleoside phosphorylase